jgi:hypothetical protein
MSIGTLIVVWLICAVIAAVISDRKNLGAGSGFVLGAILGIIGIIIVVCQKPGLPPAPAGMRAVKCTRCNAVQNVHRDQPQFECWQCKTVISLIPLGASQAIVPQPPNPRPAAKTTPVKPQSAALNKPKPPPRVLAVGAAVKIIAADDEHKDQIGTVQTFFDDADDGLDVGVVFEGDTGIYAFARNELRVTTSTSGANG